MGFRIRELLGLTGAVGFTVDHRQPWGKGTGRASYDVVQRRRAANHRAAASRRVNRGRR